MRSSRVLIRPREPAFWVYVALLVVTAAGTFAQQSSFRRISPGGWALSWGLLLLYAAPVFILIYLLDLYEREPIPLLLASFLWGAIAATQLAGFANAGWGLVVARVGGPEFASRWTAALTAPLVEETLKGLGVVLIVLIARREVDDMMDGFVYGAVCGLGFAVVEDVFYFIGVFGGSTSDVLQRVLRPRRRERVLRPRPLHGPRRHGHRLLRLAALPSFPRDAGSVCSPPCARRRWPGISSGTLPWWTSIRRRRGPASSGCSLWSRRRPRACRCSGSWRSRWRSPAGASDDGSVRRSRPEVGGSALSGIELDLLENPGRRRRSRREMKLRAGAAAATLLRRLQHEQIRLAVARTRADGAEASRSAGASEVAEQRELCTALRAALLAMPGAMPAGSLEPGHGGHR